MAERDINRVEIRGWLGQDPRDIGGGKGVDLRIKTKRSRKNKTTGQWEEADVKWHVVVVWNPPLVEYAMKLRKGATVHVVGAQLEDRQWEKDGQTRTITQAVLPGYGDCSIDGRPGRNFDAPRGQASSRVTPAQVGGPMPEFDIDVPF